MAERELLVRILGDDRDLQRALGNTERSVAAIDNRTATVREEYRAGICRCRHRRRHRCDLPRAR